MPENIVWWNPRPIGFQDAALSSTEKPASPKIELLKPVNPFPMSLCGGHVDLKIQQ